MAPILGAGGADMPLFGGLFGGANAGQQGSAGAGAALANAATAAANQYLYGEDKALGQFKRNYFDPYSRAGDQGINMLASALGLRGPRGRAGAQWAFRVSPGYQFALGQGLQGVDRGASARGLLGSGNAAMALNEYAQGLANQEYGNWLNRLTGLGSQGLQAAAGQTGRQGRLADINMWGAGGRANAYMNAARDWADIFSRGTIADQQAQSQGAANLFSAILGGLNLGLGGLG